MVDNPSQAVPGKNIPPKVNQGAEVSQEYIVRIPEANKKSLNVMRFNTSLNVDVKKWTLARLERENNIKEFKTDEDLPKYGAGSEFGREQREEARKKKHGIVTKKYNPEDQPWILEVGGRGGKKFKGIREGGVAENTSYYVFMQAPDGVFEAFPVSEWYNFAPIQRYKALTAEEAEEQYNKRDKVLNYFSLMSRKRLKNENEGEGDDDDSKSQGKKKKSSKDFVSYSL
ncbi:general transcription factor IIF subunit 1-like [Centruroides sculpturatus]|uniref:general transcription factor IIF subunit 1-like n=1 Tax=Centruroides sculpturatus TaxID=218467 RepID=UPI000C6E5EEE|nr:general transcription factor IIF subunit 1-like [Centruroides sculpturatus]